MNREEKNKIIGDLTTCLTESKNIYFTDISGLNAEQTSKLRRMCFDKGVSLSVVKNTLLKRAMDACDKDLSNLESVLKGNTTLMISDVSNAPAKIIKNFLEKNKLEKPTLKGGHVEESIYIGHDQLDVLVSLKSKEELLGDLISLLQSPMVNLVSSLKSANQNIAGILKSLENNPVSFDPKAASKDSTNEDSANEDSANEDSANEDSANEDSASVEDNKNNNEKTDE